ncbi:hypothetical protein HS960_02150 [Sphingobacterium paramultivorum]|uniref:Cellobiose phosphorylase n=1 Tax=Sphingobacterium paramultivorum TaxID=2886510 RepID=A0A7G5DXQ3_9SPHI|nr:hypothetical protein [Sphingobacterium paramultivorum]QMV66528.1 hypothetical protein HS960_02150 [Sphingobacterium paramultivorum]WSO15336.1 hypothetical protein VUL84_02140 [Sphingobacterium paramultivorum]
MKKIVGSFLLCALALNSFSQDWLPQKRDKNVLFRLLDCQYEGAKLANSSTIGGRSDNWDVKQEILQKKGTNEVTYRFTFKAKRAMKDVGVAVAFDAYNWSSDNFVMIPAVVYNGNRQRIVNREYATGLDKTDYYRKDLALTSNPIPQLSPEYGAKSQLEVNISNTSTPLMAYLDRKQHKGVFLFTDQGITWKNEVKDHALIVEESEDRSVASFVVSAPGVRSRKPEFIGFSESPDRGISVAQGDELQIRVTRLEFQSTDVPYLYTRFMQERKLHVKETAPRNLMPMSEVFTRMAKNIDERYYAKDGVGFYCPENADWMSYGWVGGLINTYPMLALGDTAHFNRVSHTFNFALPQGRGASGYYYDVLGADSQVIYRDGAKLNPGIGLTRKNADVLYWMVKQFMLLKKQGKSSLITKTWENEVKQLADAFVKTWQEEGTWGNYLAIESGKIAAYNTTGGAMAVAGLTLAASYFHNDQYLAVAKDAAKKYYDNFALVGFTSGACGDILQNADSETAIALTTSLMTLFEQTGKREYLDQAKNLANYTASWTVSFPYQLPENTALAKLGANLTGAVWASTQNKHGAPGFCTQSGDVLFKLFRETGTSLYAGLIRDVIHAHAEGIQPNGKITERLTYCDADSRGSRGDGGKTGWNETNGALMALEIPGLYVRKDKATAYAFDHILVKTVKKTSQGLSLTLHNPTAYDANVSILAEDAAEAARPLGENAFLDWNKKVNIKAGDTVVVTL